MPRNIAILVKDETQAAEGFLQAFAQEGNEVSCIVCNDLLPVALQMAHPDFAVVAARDVWGEPGDAQDLLDALGIPYLGADALTVRRCANVGETRELVRQAAAQGRLDGDAIDGVALGAAVVEALAQTGQLDAVCEHLGGQWPLVVEHDSTEPLEKGVVARDRKELAQALTALRQQGRRALVRPAIEGVEVLVPIMGDLSDILVLPPIEVGGHIDDADTWRVPVALASLADDEQDAQAIRSEIERCALDAFLACGCRDFGCVRLVWDGGRARVLGVDASPSLVAGSPLMRALVAAQVNLAELAVEFCEIADERSR